MGFSDLGCVDLIYDREWGVYWFDQVLDPALLVGPMPQS
jgi:hypothetical protein